MPALLIWLGAHHGATPARVRYPDVVKTSSAVVEVLILAFLAALMWVGLDAIFTDAHIVTNRQPGP